MFLEFARATFQSPSISPHGVVASASKCRLEGGRFDTHQRQMGIFSPYSLGPNWSWERFRYNGKAGTTQIEFITSATGEFSTLTGLVLTGTGSALGTMEKLGPHRSNLSPAPKGIFNPHWLGPNRRWECFRYNGKAGTTQIEFIHFSDTSLRTSQVP